jgi:hypothetical protein
VVGCKVVGVVGLKEGDSVVGCIVVGRVGLKEGCKVEGCKVVGVVGDIVGTKMGAMGEVGDFVFERNREGEVEGTVVGFPVVGVVGVEDGWRVVGCRVVGKVGVEDGWRVVGCMVVGVEGEEEGCKVVGCNVVGVEGEKDGDNVVGSIVVGMVGLKDGEKDGWIVGCKVGPVVHSREDTTCLRQAKYHILGLGPVCWCPIVWASWGSPHWLVVKFTSRGMLE